MRPLTTPIPLRALLGLACAAMLGACAQSPKRPHVDIADCAARTPPASVSAAEKTPYRSGGDGTGYVLHFIEFDDQGWLFPDKDGDVEQPGDPDRQIDCAFVDMKRSLLQGDDLLIHVYVHGWTHSAAEQDSDVAKFKRFLGERAGQGVAPGQRVVGIYIGWQGNTIDVPLLDNLTFWGRKNAAERVSQGRVREVFSRIRGLRNYWNGPASLQPRAGRVDVSMLGAPKKRIHTIMVGHSFGGLILYNATSPYVLEALATQRDLPDDHARALDRDRGIADLIVLLNPAFEASMYEPVHRAAMAYVPQKYEPPLLVNISSTADRATKNLFPAVRYVNALLQYPATSDEQSTAMRRTPVNVDAYTTHHVDVRGEPEACDLDHHRRLADGFFDRHRKSDRKVALPPGWERELCGNITVRHQRPDEKAAGETPINVYTPVWNIRVDERLIKDHNDVASPRLVAFLDALYADLRVAQGQELVAGSGERAAEAAAPRSRVPGKGPAP